MICFKIRRTPRAGALRRVRSVLRVLNKCCIVIEGGKDGKNGTQE